MIRRHYHSMALLVAFNDAVLLCAAWLATYWLRFSSGLLPVYLGLPEYRYYLYALAPVVAVWLGSLRHFGLYRPQRARRFRREALDILKASLSASLLLMAGFFFYRGYSFSRLLVWLFLIVSTLAMLVERGCVRLLLAYLRARGINTKRVVFIGWGKKSGQTAARIIDNPHWGFEVIGAVVLGKKPQSQQPPGRAWSFEELPEVLHQHLVDIAIVEVPFSRPKTLMRIVRLAEARGVTLRIIPEIPQGFSLVADVDEFDGCPLIGLSAVQIGFLGGLQKRLLDLAVAVPMLIVLSPLFLLLGVLIKLDSPGPVIYRQKRLTLNGREFYMYKFRSMVTGAEERTGPVWASEDDARCTRLGGFMRRWNLDELPQLLNVVKGEMSLVGPRSERPELAQRFVDSVPRYLHRHWVKGGMTGWAQVNGRRGNTSLPERIAYDLYYIRNWSIWFDIRILLLTLWQGRRNAY